MTIGKLLYDWFGPGSSGASHSRTQGPKRRPVHSRGGSGSRHRQTRQQHAKRTVKSHRSRTRRPAPVHCQRPQVGRTAIAYHGTPSQNNAASIFKHGWLVGTGNALGDGIYLATDLSTAKGYAGSSGVYLKCQVALGKSCQWDTAMQARYAAWCRKRSVAQDNSAITAFLIRQCGFNTVVNGNVLVVLAPQYANPSAWKRKHQQIRILSVHRAADDVRIRV